MSLMQAAEWVASARRVAVLTGAGVSAASGLRTYRDPGGMWDDRQLFEAHHASSLPASLPIVWSVKGPLRAQALGAKPNAAHLAIVELAKVLWQHEARLTVVTQNIDGLHQKAGSEGVLELHGSVHYSRCCGPGCDPYPFEDRTIPEPGTVPPCPSCHRPLLRPAVVLFDEPLPRGAISAARAAMEEADCLLVVGTSGAVSTATNMVGIALASGANCVLVNKEPWAEGIFDSEVLGPAEESLPELVRTAALVHEVRRRRA